MRTVTSVTEPFDFASWVVVQQDALSRVDLPRTPISNQVLVVKAEIDKPGEVDAIMTPARAFELRGTDREAEHAREGLGREFVPQLLHLDSGSKGTLDDWEGFGGPEWNWNKCREYLYKVTRDLLRRPAGDPAGAEGHRRGRAWVSKGGMLTDEVHGGGTMRGPWKSTKSFYGGKRSSSWAYLEGKANVAKAVGGGEAAGGRGAAHGLLRTGEGMKDLVTTGFPWDMPLTSDEAMHRQILERSQTGFHPCGSTRMGKDIHQGVVDGNLEVHGKAVYMVAEKGVDIIKASYPHLYS
ncbi:hypothetical protein F4780DRAFT_780512 [Xylariomycetidae sp. FL0641]|nr:hypothetical protein F4780DRAFT_780512 [Xylariomycetidae sp. FL0641]